MRGWAGGIVVALCLLAATPGRGQAPADQDQFLLSADQVTYDEELGIVVAAGNVEIVRGERILLADSVTYNERAGTVTAAGNVSLLEPTGEVLFADYAELTDDLKEGVIENIRALLADQTRIAAAAGRRTDGNRTEFDKAVFSPCALCPDDPTRAPLWQIKAVKVVHNQKEHTVQYKDAWIEILGVPVLYTPYFEHPDPTVKRKSGFLAPDFGLSDTLGYQIQIPYFWNIAPDKDATFSPLFTTDQGVVMVGEYRQRVVDGQFTLGGSGTITDREEVAGGRSITRQNQFRGHIDSFGRFDIDDNWRWGFEANRATDKTYLRFYDFSNERTLTSRAFAEGFYGRDYVSARALTFQGLRQSDDNDESPIVLPILDYNYVGEPGRFGGYFTLDANALVLTRVQGRDSRRLSVEAGWTLPYTAPAGDIYTLAATLRGDGYWVDDVDPTSDEPNPAGDNFGGLEGRLFPQLSLNWRFPFVRDHSGAQEVIEPMAGVVAATSTGNQGEIPNEDSLDIEFDETNLFKPNRFAGLDRVDSGQRVIYGLKWSLIGDDGGYGSVFLGQSHQIDDNDNFRPGSGLSDNLSDIVGRIQASSQGYFDLLYRFRVDPETLITERNEVTLSAGPPALNLSLSYLSLHPTAGAEAEFADREEVSGVLGSQINDNWYAYVTGRHDIQADHTQSYGFGATYRDECLELRATATRNFFRDEEKGPETKVLLTVVFKYLGEVGAKF